MLKYLFTAEYKDGTSYAQNAEDVSVVYAPEEKKSSFADVDIPNVKRFSLTGEGHTYTVDLTDGHFEIDGVPFTMHDQRDDCFTDFQLIFARRHWHDFNLAMEEKAHSMVYRIGWIAKKDDRSHQRVMTIA